MKPCLIFMFTIFTCLLVHSQNYVDLLKLHASTSPMNAFDSSSVKTDLNEISCDLTIPIKLNEKNTLLSGVIYENIETKLFAEGITKKFGSTALKLGLNRQLNSKWYLTSILLPKIASDYNSISNQDFQIGALALFKYKKTDDVNFKVGLYYNSELFGPFFVPIVGLYYLSPNKRFESNFMLPLQADVNYKLLSFMDAGCNFNGQIRSYHLEGMKAANPSTYVAKSTNELYVYLKFSLTNNINLQTKMGHSLGRSYRVYDESDKVSFAMPLAFFGPKREQLNTDFSDGMIYQVNLIYRLNL